MPSNYIEFQNPVSVRFSRTIPVLPFYTMKSLFSDNSRVLYKTGGLASGGVGTVKNQRHKWKHT
jgi:hypothetical protein